VAPESGRSGHVLVVDDFETVVETDQFIERDS
jgi:hypothetical protein